MQRHAPYLTVVALSALVCGIATPAFAQGPAVVTPNDNLVAEGIPAISRARVADVRRYTETRAAFLADWHPTRREMLIATRFGNTYQVHRVREPGGARTQLTFFEDPVYGGTYEPRDGRYFLFERAEGGNEFTQLYRFDANGRITLLTDGRRSQNGGVVWSTVGDRIAYGSTGRNGADRDIYVMDPADPSTNRLVLQVSGGGWGVADWSPDDRQLLVSEGISVNQSYLWLVDVASGEKTLLTPREDTVAYGGAEFASNGRGIYATADKDSEFQRLVYIDLATRRLTPLLTDIPWDVVGFDVSPDGRRIALIVNEAGVSKLYLYDVAARRAHAVTGVPTGIVFGPVFHNNSRDLGFSLTSARSVADVYSVDVTTGRLSRWTESELGGLVGDDLSVPTLIRWPSFDRLEITGFLYRPPARFTGRRPVIIDIHGGPEGQATPGFIGSDNYFLNELGAAIILPNVRGSTGYGKTFVRLDNGMRREDAGRDIGALLDWIAQQPDLDSSHVMVTGGSYGGYMALAVATTYNDRIACALDVVGISHFGTFLRNTEAYRRDLRRVEYGDERDPEMAAFFERIAPLNNADRITKPLFVVQGANDPRVRRSESEQMVARVRQNGSPVWYLMARDEGHGFAKKDNQDFQFYATVMFIRRFLLGEPQPPTTP